MYRGDKWFDYKQDCDWLIHETLYLTKPSAHWPSQPWQHDSAQGADVHVPQMAGSVHTVTTRSINCSISGVLPLIWAVLRFVLGISFQLLMNRKGYVPPTWHGWRIRSTSSCCMMHSILIHDVQSRGHLCLSKRFLGWNRCNFKTCCLL